MLSGIDAVRSTSLHRDRDPRRTQRTSMRGTVNTPGKAGHHGHARLGQTLTDRPREFEAVDPSRRGAPTIATSGPVSWVASPATSSSGAVSETAASGAGYNGEKIGERFVAPLLEHRDGAVEMSTLKFRLLAADLECRARMFRALETSECVLGNQPECRLKLQPIAKGSLFNRIGAVGVEQIARGCIRCGLGKEMRKQKRNSPGTGKFLNSAPTAASRTNACEAARVIELLLESLGKVASRAADRVSDRRVHVGYGPRMRPPSLPETVTTTRSAITRSGVLRFSFCALSITLTPPS